MSNVFGDGKFFRLETADDGAWQFLAVDGLGHGRLAVNLMQTAKEESSHAMGDWSIQALEPEGLELELKDLQLEHPNGFMGMLQAETDAPRIRVRVALDGNKAQLAWRSVPALHPPFS